MALDAATRTLWVAGDVRLDEAGTRTRSTITAYDADTGAQKRRVVVPGQRFLNDVQVTDTNVYVTDSFGDQLVKVDLAGFTLLRMTGDWAQPEGFGANGIRELPGGALLVTNSSTGELFRVNRSTGVADRIELTGPALSSGDGLVLDGTTLYVVHGFATDEIAVVESVKSQNGRQMPPPVVARQRPRSPSHSLVTSPNPGSQSRPMQTDVG